MDKFTQRKPGGSFFQRDGPVIKKRSFVYLFFRDIGRLVRRKYRNRRSRRLTPLRPLLPLPHPFRDLGYNIYGLFKGKAYRSRPWSVKIEHDEAHSYFASREETRAALDRELRQVEDYEIPRIWPPTTLDLGVEPVPDCLEKNLEYFRQTNLE